MLNFFLAPLFGLRMFGLGFFTGGGDDGAFYDYLIMTYYFCYFYSRGVSCLIYFVDDISDSSL
jgi:hypothetical protein